MLLGGKVIQWLRQKFILSFAGMPFTTVSGVRSDVVALKQAALEARGADYGFDPTVMTRSLPMWMRAQVLMLHWLLNLKLSTSMPSARSCLKCTGLGLRRADNGQVMYKVGGLVMMGRTMRELPAMEEDTSSGD